MTHRFAVIFHLHFVRNFRKHTSLTCAKLFSRNAEGVRGLAHAFGVAAKRI